MSPFNGLFTVSQDIIFWFLQSVQCCAPFQLLFHSNCRLWEFHELQKQFWYTKEPQHPNQLPDIILDPLHIVEPALTCQDTVKGLLRMFCGTCAVQDLGAKAGVTLDKSSVNRRADISRQTTVHTHIHTCGQIYSDQPTYLILSQSSQHRPPCYIFFSGFQATTQRRRERREKPGHSVLLLIIIPLKH